MPMTLTVLRCPDSVPPETRTVMGGEFTVGRGPGVDWILPDPERLLSKHHFAVAYRGGNWQIADTSTNGTTLNRDPGPIGHETVRNLHDGDRITLGAYEIEVRLTEDAMPQAGFGGGMGFAAPPPSRGASPFADPFARDPFAPPPDARRPFDEAPSPGFGAVPTGAQLPHDFDPLAPEPGEAAFLGPTQADHRPALEDAFQPQAIGGQMAFQGGGKLPGDDLLPDDWDKDLLEGINPPSAPVGAPPAGSPILPSRAQPFAQPAPPPVPQPFAQPMPSAASPFAQPAPQPVAEQFVRATPAHGQDPFAEPALRSGVRPAVPPAANPFAEPAPQPAGRHTAPAEEPFAAPAVQPMVQPVAQPVAQPIAQPVVQPVVQPVEQAVVQPIVQPMVQPLAREEQDPFAEPAVPQRSGVTMAQAAASAARTPTPFDEPFDFEPAQPRASVATPVAPVAAATPTPAQPTAADGALLAAFLQGVGMTDVQPTDAAAMMRNLGEAFRTLVSGLRAVLIARASIKSEFRIEQTMIRARGNNPLKFSAGDDDALAALLGTGRRTDMTAAAAVADALKDIRLHELASMAAMQAAVRTLLDGLDPAKLRAQAEQGGGLSVLPAQRKARAWDAYETMHARTVQALADDFDSVFGKAFARAYERALDEVAARER
ncbi:MAG TPA: type VI secretion system-associated FHA domain protein TagH [Acetobacteraceae bacterium]|nr:type VI secretion system-associated FHA domain protein TagH [Acetobacteraceae bacterium]